MVNLETLSFFDGLPAEPLEELAGDAQERTFRPGDLIVRQHEEANTIFILLSGHVQFLLRFEGVDDLLVGQTGVPGTLLGWSALRPPYRYTATVRCDDVCRAVRFPRSRLDDLIGRYPAFGYQLLKRVAQVLADRLENGRDLLVRPSWLEHRVQDGLEDSWRA